MRTSKRSPVPSTRGIGSPSAEAAGREYEDVPGFCRTAPLAEIKEAGYARRRGAMSVRPRCLKTSSRSMRRLRGSRANWSRLSTNRPGWRKLFASSWSVWDE